MTTDIGDVVALKRQITLFQAVSICVGYMIGSGIFVSPYGVLKEVGSVGMSLIIWGVCGIFNLLGALCYAELGTTLPESGGEYLYILKGLGRFPAFLALWTTFVLVLAVMTTASSLIFATYILQPLYLGCDVPDEVVKLVAASTLCLLMIINCFNVNWSAKVQILFALCAVVALVAIIGIGLYSLATGQTTNFDKPFTHSNYNPDAMAVAFYSAFWSYSGWNSLNSIAGEIKNPERNLPWAIVISMCIVTSVYMLANIAYMSVLTLPDMLSSEAIAMTFADQTLGNLSWTMPLFVACSIIGTINGGLLAVSRVFFVGAQDGNFPLILSMINYRFLTPAPSIIATTLLSILLIQYNNIFFLIEVVGFALACILGTTYLSMFCMRVKHPEWKRPIKFPLALPFLLMVLYYILLILTVYRKPYESLICIGVMAAGIPFYWIGVCWTNRPASLQRTFDTITATLQKILLIVPQHGSEMEVKDTVVAPTSDLSATQDRITK